jgi:hypothetical protein
MRSSAVVFSFIDRFPGPAPTREARLSDADSLGRVQRPFGGAGVANPFVRTLL